MSNQYAFKSWLYAAGVSAALLLLMSLNNPAQAGQINEPISAAPMQLARGGNFLVPSPRRTQSDKNPSSQATPEQSKDAAKTAPGMQGPTGKTPDQDGPDGIKKTQPADVTNS